MRASFSREMLFGSGLGDGILGSTKQSVANLISESGIFNFHISFVCTRFPVHWKCLGVLSEQKIWILP